jgi:hypothetical protein
MASLGYSDKIHMSFELVKNYKRRRTFLSEDKKI